MAGRETGSRGSLSTIPTIERSASEGEKKLGENRAKQLVKFWAALLVLVCRWCDLREHYHPISVILCFKRFRPLRSTLIGRKVILLKISASSVLPC